MTTITFDYNTDVFRTLARMIVGWPVKAGKAIYKHVTCARAERQLNAMDAHLLADIGIHRGDIHSKVWGKL